MAGLLVGRREAELQVSNMTPLDPPRPGGVSMETTWTRRVSVKSREMFTSRPRPHGLRGRNEMMLSAFGVPLKIVLTKKNLKKKKPPPPPQKKKKKKTVADITSSGPRPVANSWYLPARAGATEGRGARREW